MVDFVPNNTVGFGSVMDFVGWLVVLTINVALLIFQPYRELEEITNLKTRSNETENRTSEAKSWTTTPSLLLG